MILSLPTSKQPQLHHLPSPAAHVLVLGSLALIQQAENKVFSQVMTSLLLPWYRETGFMGGSLGSPVLSTQWETEKSGSLMSFEWVLQGGHNRMTVDRARWERAPEDFSISHAAANEFYNGLVFPSAGLLYCGRRFVLKPRILPAPVCKSFVLIIL